MNTQVTPEMAYNAYNGLDDETYNSLREYGGYTIMKGFVDELPFTALFGENEEAFEHVALFQYHKDHDRLVEFIDGMNHQATKANPLVRKEYARGFDNGVAFIQNEFFALLGKSGAAFIQGAVNEMKRREPE